MKPIIVAALQLDAAYVLLRCLGGFQHCLPRGEVVLCLEEVHIRLDIFLAGDVVLAEPGIDNCGMQRFTRSQALS